MKNKIKKKVSRQDLNVLVVVMIISAFTLIAFVLLLYTGFYVKAEKDAIDIAKKDVVIISEMTDTFIAKSINVTNVTASNMEYMLSAGKNKDELEDYLVKETLLFQNGIDANYRALYGVFDGEYVDGNAWIPESDYNPYDRPWYKEAVKANGKAVIISPYLDADTGSMVITVAKLMADKKSVLAVDILTEDIKTYASKIEDAGWGYAFITDSEGMIISAGKEELIYTNYLDDDFAGGQTLSDLLKYGNSYTEPAPIEYMGDEYVVFSNEVTGGWKVIVAIDRNTVLVGPRQVLYYSIALIAFMIVALSFYIVHSFVTEKQHIKDQTERLNMLEKHEKALSTDLAIINSVAGEFDYVCLVNAGDNTINNYRVGGIFAKYIPKESEYIDPLDFDMVLNKLIPKSEIGSFLTECDRDNILKYLLSHKEYSINFNVVDEGELYHYKAVFTTNPNAKSGAIVAFKNITSEINEKKEKEEALKKASIDGLTGLLNKSTFIEKVDDYLRKNSAKNVVFIYLDLDNFKKVNDTFGHSRGDTIIQITAVKITKCFRNGEMIARLGGDEFAIFIPSITEEQLRERIAKLAGELQIDFTEGGTTVELSGSIGCLINDSELADYDLIHEKADRLMYKVKNGGKNGYNILRM